MGSVRPVRVGVDDDQHGIGSRPAHALGEAEQFGLVDVVEA
jgi:hypothetical protein